MMRRFRIRTLMILVALVAVGLGFLQLWRENQRLRADLQASRAAFPAVSYADIIANIDSRFAVPPVQPPKRSPPPGPPSSP